MLREDLQDKLLERFPWVESIDHNGVGRGRLAPCWCGNGWYQLIFNMLEEVDNLYEAKNLPIDLKVWEIKEKYAGMRVDISGGLPEVYGIIERYEKLSEETCDTCGDKGSIREINGWLTVYCDSCFEIESEPVFRYYDENENLFINEYLYNIQTPIFIYIDINGNQRVGKYQVVARSQRFQGIIDSNVNSQTWFNSMTYFDANGRTHLWGGLSNPTYSFRYFDNLGNEFITSPVDEQPLLLRGFDFQGIIKPNEL